MLKYLCSILIALQLGLFFLVHPVQATNLEFKRQLFLQAEQALQNGQQDLYQKNLEQLKDYPLLGYLQQQDLEKRLHPSLEPEIQNFLQTYAGQPVAETLRKPWLKLLGQEQLWDQYLHAYTPQKDLDLQCFYGQALWSTGQGAKAWAHTDQLWLTGSSLPKTCDPLLLAWKNAGRLNYDQAWQRVTLAMAQGQTNLARYLQRYLAPKDQPWLELWLQVAQKPELILTHNWQGATTENPKTMALILETGMRALIRKNPVLAARQWDKLVHEHQLKAHDYPDIENYLALYLCFRFEPQAISRVLAIPLALRQDNLRQWAVRTALRHEDWSTVQTMLMDLSSEQQAEPRWTYWQGRTHQALGQTFQAREVFASLSQNSDYHGFLATQRLGQPLKVHHAPLEISVLDLENIIEHPGLQRAAELRALKRWGPARREWQAAQKKMDQNQLLAAAWWANERQWTDRTIVATLAAGHNQDLTLLYPTPYLDLITRYGQQHNLPPALILGLTRQESLFMSDIGSSAGALGLMQIMPQTGQQIATWHGEKLTSPWHLLQPDRNIRYGTSYLRRQLDNLQNHPALALAAYNAGPGRAKSWLPAQPMATDIWIETIVFNETRQYVEKVLSNTLFYTGLLNLNAPAQALELPPIQPSL